MASIACGERDGIAFGSSDLEFVAMGMLAIAIRRISKFTIVGFPSNLLYSSFVPQGSLGKPPVGGWHHLFTLTLSGSSPSKRVLINISKVSEAVMVLAVDLSFLKALHGRTKKKRQRKSWKCQWISTLIPDRTAGFAIS